MNNNQLKINIRICISHLTSTVYRLHFAFQFYRHLFFTEAIICHGYLGIVFVHCSLIIALMSLTNLKNFVYYNVNH